MPLLDSCQHSAGSLKVFSNLVNSMSLILCWSSTGAAHTVNMHSVTQDHWERKVRKTNLSSQRVTTGHQIVVSPILAGADRALPLLSFQSLFQLPEFRRLVLGYSLPQNVLESCRHTVSFDSVTLSSFLLLWCSVLLLL